MPDEIRSLWEIYDSETPPWKRGRGILVWIGLLFFLLQCLAVFAQMVLGKIDALLIYGLLIVLFWLQFYFVWIGVQWLRWLWGGWNLLTGFCFLIWAWRDTSALETIYGTLNILLGAALCSPSVYLFAKRQKETVRWKESLLFAAACFLLLFAIGSAGFGAKIVRMGMQRDACNFTDDAAEHIYREHETDWARAHVTPQSLQENGTARLGYFFEQVRNGLGPVRELRRVAGLVQMRFHFPLALDVSAHTVVHAELAYGSAELHFLLLKSNREWKIDHMWWNYLPGNAQRADPGL